MMQSIFFIYVKSKCELLSISLNHILPSPLKNSYVRVILALVTDEYFKIFHISFKKVYLILRHVMLSNWRFLNDILRNYCLRTYLSYDSTTFLVIMIVVETMYSLYGRTWKFYLDYLGDVTLAKYSP